MFMDYYFFLFFIMLVVFLFYLSCDYFIKVLVFIEFAMIVLVTYYFVLFDSEFFYFVLYFLIFSVCEGVLGLSVLSLLISFYGSDLLGFCNLVF